MLASTFDQPDHSTSYESGRRALCYKICNDIVCRISTVIHLFPDKKGVCIDIDVSNSDTTVNDTDIHELVNEIETSSSVEEDLDELDL